MRSMVTEAVPLCDGLVDGMKLTHLMSRSQDIQAGYIDGELACIWGLVPSTILSDRAYLWLYTTDVVKEHTFIFIRQSQLAVENMLQLYATLHGNVEIDNDKAKAWLKWLGAQFGEPRDGRIPFVIGRN